MSDSIRLFYLQVPFILVLYSDIYKVVLSSGSSHISVVFRYQQDFFVAGHNKVVTIGLLEGAR